MHGAGVGKWGVGVLETLAQRDTESVAVVLGENDTLGVGDFEGKEDWEEVTVPAGKFRALKIEGNGRSVGGPINGTRKVTLWYAPEVANYVRMEFEMSYSPAAGKSIQELSSFSLKQ